MQFSLHAQQQSACVTFKHISAPIRRPWPKNIEQVLSAVLAFLTCIRHLSQLSQLTEWLQSNRTGFDSPQDNYCYLHHHLKTEAEA
jgi:hypothetical protein